MEFEDTPNPAQFNRSEPPAAGVGDRTDPELRLAGVPHDVDVRRFVRLVGVDVHKVRYGPSRSTVGIVRCGLPK